MRFTFTNDKIFKTYTKHLLRWLSEYTENGVGVIVRVLMQFNNCMLSIHLEIHLLHVFQKPSTVVVQIPTQIHRNRHWHTWNVKYLELGDVCTFQGRFAIYMRKIWSQSFQNSHEKVDKRSIFKIAIITPSPSPLSKWTCHFWNSHFIHWLIIANCS